MNNYSQSQEMVSNNNYNTSDELAVIFKKHINKILSWQQKRAGLMDHILSQKIGLYYHTSASDIAPNTKVNITSGF